MQFLFDNILCTKPNLKGFEWSHKNSTISPPIRNEMLGFGKEGFSWHSPWIFQSGHKFTNPCLWPHTLGLNCAYLWLGYQVMRGSVPWISFLSSCPPKRTLAARGFSFFFHDRGFAAQFSPQTTGKKTLSHPRYPKRFYEQQNWIEPRPL